MIYLILSIILISIGAYFVKKAFKISKLSKRFNNYKKSISLLLDSKTDFSQKALDSVSATGIKLILSIIIFILPYSLLYIIFSIYIENIYINIISPSIPYFILISLKNDQQI